MGTVFAYKKDFAFNAICPYYTMFPLEFPMHLLKKYQAKSPTVWDPFCGRGTTIYAARKCGLRSYGLDTSPIAVAIAQAKLASAELENVIALAEKLVARTPKNVPDKPFFKRAFSRKTLLEVCSLREGLLNEKNVTNESAILRAAALGCLHGPLPEGAEIIFKDGDKENVAIDNLRCQSATSASRARGTRNQYTKKRVAVELMQYERVLRSIAFKRFGWLPADGVAELINVGRAAVAGDWNVVARRKGEAERSGPLRK